MNIGKTLFAQLMDFLPWSTFARIVARYGGDARVRTLCCAEQYRAMAFAQLTYRESLRDIEVCLSARASKLYHIGFREPVRPSTLADANETRDWRFGQRGEDANILRGFRLRPGRHRQEAPRLGGLPLHFAPGFLGHPLRENADVPGIFRKHDHFRRRRTQQPVEFIPFLTDSSDRHYGKIAAGWALLTIISLLLAYGGPVALAAVIHAILGEYLSFILLLLALYTVAGGILVTGDLPGSPLTNTGLLALGT